MIGCSVLRVFSLEAVCSLGSLTITHAIFGFLIIIVQYTPKSCSNYLGPCIKYYKQCIALSMGLGT